MCFYILIFVLFVFLHPVGPLSPGPGPTVRRSDGHMVGRLDGGTASWGPHTIDLLFEA